MEEGALALGGGGGGGHSYAPLRGPGLAVGGKLPPWSPEPWALGQPLGMLAGDVVMTALPGEVSAACGTTSHPRNGPASLGAAGSHGVGAAPWPVSATAEGRGPATQQGTRRQDGWGSAGQCVAAVGGMWHSQG